jgi:hypothetical protein
MVVVVDLLIVLSHLPVIYAIPPVDRLPRATISVWALVVVAVIAPLPLARRQSLKVM